MFRQKFTGRTTLLDWGDFCQPGDYPLSVPTTTFDALEFQVGAGGVTNGFMTHFIHAPRRFVEGDVFIIPINNYSGFMRIQFPDPNTLRIVSVSPSLTGSGIRAIYGFSMSGT